MTKQYNVQEPLPPLTIYSFIQYRHPPPLKLCTTGTGLIMLCFLLPSDSITLIMEVGFGELIRNWLRIHTSSSN
ncbi:hypothetical protein HMPREF1544_08645 [Mucor circinelloides 1006PhL]|uniref:Uncharacterized protein n=1 Tax=Mucor circinelloides f. circinelloides (strain 1006PhL) TaxID=1220926 RepID=S2JPT8_MUCC1|nr:hypothetical protein HMPREF1544_08645 [Mucor circinelloides 1006PhL]